MSKLSIIVDLRCPARGDAFTQGVIDSVVGCARNFSVAACLESNVTAAPPPTVALYSITHNGPCRVMHPVVCGPSAITDIQDAITHAARGLAPLPAPRAAVDPIVFHTLAVRNAIEAAAGDPDEPAVADAAGGHVVLLVACVGPAVDTPALGRVLAPSPTNSSDSGASLTAVLVLPEASTRPSDTFLHCRMRVVRPRPDRKTLQRVLAGPIAAGLGLCRTTPLALEFPGTTSQPLQLAVSSAAATTEASRDWLRNMLVAPENSDGTRLAVRGVVPAAQVSEAWLTGVPAVTRVDAVRRVIDGCRRGGVEIAGDGDLLRALCARLDRDAAVLLLQACQDLRCADGDSVSTGRPWYVALPWARDGTALLLRQLIPSELRRPDALERRAAQPSSETPDDATTQRIDGINAALDKSLSAAHPLETRADITTLRTARSSTAESKPPLGPVATTNLPSATLISKPKAKRQSLHDVLRQSR